MKSSKRGVLRGHMSRARRAFLEHLQLVDVVLEITDARIPRTGRHPKLARWAGRKPVLLVLNKVDLADPEVTRRWCEFFRQADQPVVLLNARSGEGRKQLLRCVRELRVGASRKRRALRLLAVGLPNVGKSSLLNRLAGARRARTGAAPGITRGEQWIRVSADLQLLDLPGILTPTLDDPAVAWRLLVTGIVTPADVSVEAAALELLAYLAEHYPDRLKDRYGEDVLEGPPDPPQAAGPEGPPAASPLPAVLLERIGRRSGCLGRGGTVDAHRAGQLVIEQVRQGLMGRLSLEEPPAPPL